MKKNELYLFLKYLITELTQYKPNEKQKRKEYLTIIDRLEREDEYNRSGKTGKKRG